MNSADLHKHSFGSHDIPHLGALCRRVREARAIAGSEMARYCNAPSTRTITTDFERQNKIGAQYFERYIQALQSPAIAPNPITPTHAQMLTHWYTDKSTARLDERIRQLAAIDFEDICPATQQRPAQLADLAQQLAHERRPALIMDDLWFIHALNQAQLGLYSIKPDSAFLQRWDGWHTIAGKVATDSPVRQAHSAHGQFVPPTLAFFYESRNTYPYLFTLQMRVFMHALLTLSQEHAGDIHLWWHQLTTFSLPYHTFSIPREVQINDSTIFATPQPVKSIAVQMPGSHHPVRYTLVAWDILGTSNPDLLDSLHSRSPQRVFYAHEFDPQRRFHINRWPAVQQLLEAWDLG